MVDDYHGSADRMAYGISVAVLHKWMDDIDGYGKSASPCPSDIKLWLQGALILAVYKRSRHTRMPKSDTRDRVFHQ
jgi:hypothetical protein